jgi:hypothetical protein
MPKYLVSYHGGGEKPSAPESWLRWCRPSSVGDACVGPALLGPGAPLAQAMTVSAGGVKGGHERANWARRLSASTVP